MSKHLDTKVHFIRDYVEDGILKVVYVQGDKNYADPMTKNVNHKNMVKNFDYMDDLNRFSDV